MMDIDGIPLDRFFPLSQAAGKIPGRRPGKAVGRSTLERWRLKGVRGVLLRTVRIGATVCTCDEWIADFVRGLNAGQPPGASPAARTPTQRERAAAQAREKLKAAWEK